MKYWVFQNNQVTGPFDPEDLPQTPGYSGDALVCPEGRKGTNMGDWQRASMVPELSVSIIKASQLALAVKGGGYPALPPEPTLKDLAALGSLQEKVSLLDNMVAHLQESLRIKDDELLSLHKELQDKARYAQELAVKLGGVEERLSGVNQLRDGLDKAVAAEHDVEATVQKQAGFIEQLKTELDAMRVEQKKMDELKEELARQRSDNESSRESMERRLSETSAKADAAKEEAEKAEAAAKAMPTPQALPPISSAPLTVSPLSGASLPPSPLSPVMPMSLPKSELGLATERPSMPAFTPATAPDPSMLQPAPEPLKPLSLSEAMGPTLKEVTPLSPISPIPLAPGPSPLAATPAPSVVSSPAPAAKSGSKKGLVLVVAVIAAAGGYVYLKMGAAKKTAMNAALTPTPSLPPAAPEPPKPSAEEILEDQKKQAVELLRSWQLPDGAPVAVKLEVDAPQPGGLSPWFADKIRDGLFQVNYYAPKGSKLPEKAYEFEVWLADRKITGHNPAAIALLEGKPLTAPKGAKGKKAKAGGVTKARKPKIRPKEAPMDDGQNLLGDLLDMGDESTPAKPKTTKPKAKAKLVQPEGEDVLIDGSGAALDKPAATAKEAKRNVDHELEALLDGGEAKATAKPSGGNESLDDLLLPGVPKARPSTAKPQEPDLEAPVDPLPPDVSEAKPTKTAPKVKKMQAADAALLEDLLKP